jgi:hypothetical protein
MPVWNTQVLLYTAQYVITDRTSNRTGQKSLIGDTMLRLVAAHLVSSETVGCHRVETNRAMGYLSKVIHPVSLN